MLRIALAVTVLALAAGAGTTSAATGPGTFSGGAGCSVQCIETALVEPTASSATVHVGTSVPASVTVAVAKVGAAPALAAPGGAQPHVTQAPFALQRSIVLPGLEPETAYRIVVTARDLQGRTSVRAGTFTTRRVKVAVGTGAGSFASGHGCSGGCIQRALLTQSRVTPSTATVDFRAAVPATLRLLVRRGNETVAALVSAGETTSWTPTVSGLLPGTTYAVEATATDAQGRVDRRTGTFRTVEAVARVTLAKITVVDDAEKGANRGELRFTYRVNDVGQDGGGLRKIGSGTTLGAPVAGTSRPGATFAVPAHAGAVLDVRVRGLECDRVMKKTCLIDGAAPAGWKPSGGSNGKKEQHAWAVGVFDLEDVLRAGALPPWHGTGVEAPAGHDGYFVVSTSDFRVKFRVLAHVDLEHRFED